MFSLDDHWCIFRNKKLRFIIFDILKDSAVMVRPEIHRRRQYLSNARISRQGIDNFVKVGYEKKEFRVKGEVGLRLTHSIKRCSLRSAHLQLETNGMVG
jgi:hypothetical protein